MNRPPFAERLLLGFLTDPALGDVVLGDLAEEWQVRITRDGRTSANLWYWGQAIRTMPHLLLEWCVNATRRDVGLRLAGVLVVFGIATLPAAAAHVTANLGLGIARVMLGSLSAVDGGMPLTLNWLEIAGTPLAVSAICALSGAYVLGSRSRVAPLVSVFWLGAAWIAVSTALPLALRWPSWYFVALPAALAVATASGGILAVLRPLHAGTSVLVVVLVAVTAPASAQTAKPVPESDAIAVLTREIRALRQEIAETARASLKLQSLTARIQAQEQRIIYLDRQRADAATRRSEAEQARDDIAGQIQRLAGRELSKVTPAQRRDIEGMLATYKQQVATQHTLVLQLQTEEANAASWLAQEQGRWADLNQRLEDLERSLK